MELDAPEVHDPREPRGVVDDDLLGGSPRREAERHRAQPLGSIVRRALLIERLAVGAVDEPLEHDGPIANTEQGTRRDREVIADEIELRDLRLAVKYSLLRVRDLDLAALDREDLRRFFLCHDESLSLVTDEGAADRYARAIANLRVRDVNEPGLGADDVRVAIEAAAINPSDLASAKGAFLGAPLPRILGRDFAGTVIDGPPELVGARVWGSGGDLGISRDGTHAESIVIPRAAVAVRPTNLTAEQAAAVGVPYVTAWAALDLAGVRAGETVLVAGAAGAVGTAAIQLAHVRGAHVVAVTHNNAAERNRAAGNEGGGPDVPRPGAGRHGGRAATSRSTASVHPCSTRCSRRSPTEAEWSPIRSRVAAMRRSTCSRSIAGESASSA